MEKIFLFKFFSVFGLKTVRLAVVSVYRPISLLPFELPECRPEGQGARVSPSPSRPPSASPLSPRRPSEAQASGPEETEPWGRLPRHLQVRPGPPHCRVTMCVTDAHMGWTPRGAVGERGLRHGKDQAPQSCCSPWGFGQVTFLQGALGFPIYKIVLIKLPEGLKENVMLSGRWRLKPMWKQARNDKGNWGRDGPTERAPQAERRTKVGIPRVTAKAKCVTPAGQRGPGAVTSARQPGPEHVFSEIS